MARALLVLLFGFAIACNPDTPYGGATGVCFMVSVDTHAQHYPFTILINDREYGKIYEARPAIPVNCGELYDAFLAQIDPGRQVVRIDLPVGTYDMKALPSNSSTTLTATLTVNEYCNYIYIPDF